MPVNNKRNITIVSPSKRKKLFPVDNSIILAREKEVIAIINVIKRVLIRVKAALTGTKRFVGDGVGGISLSLSCY
jgi:hypothetical protein